MVLILGIFLLSLASAQIETNYYIYQNKVLVEYYFDSVSDLELRIPYDVGEPEVNSEYELEDLGNYYLLKINSAENLSVKYITESMIDKVKNKFYFTSKNYLGDSQKVKLVLPESAVLVQEGIVFPEPDSISSDGRSIILEWDDYNDEQIVINYEFVKDNIFIFYIIILILILFFIGYLIFQKKIKGKPKKHKDLTRNLFEDEKKIIEYLLDKKDEVWTKEILKDLSISKIKLSRKLRSLEQKELIKKIPYGNENKIKLIKK